MLRRRLAGDGRLGFGADLDFDSHAEVIGRKPGPGAGNRYRLAGIANDRDADQIVVADNAVGRIELHPPRTRQINLEPGMGGAIADPAAAAVFRDVEIAADKARREAERAHRLDHQHREIATAAAAEL